MVEEVRHLRPCPAGWSSAVGRRLLRPDDALTRRPEHAVLSLPPVQLPSDSRVSEIFFRFILLVFIL